MDKQQIAERTIALIEKTFGAPKESITPDAKLSDLAADSIQLFELVIACEKEFNLQASYEDLMQIVTVQDTLDYLEKVLSPKPA